MMTVNILKIKIAYSLMSVKKYTGLRPKLESCEKPTFLNNGDTEQPHSGK
jgi:hypothetical protein